MGVEPKCRWTPIAEASRVLVDAGLVGEQGLLFLMEHMSVDISKAKAELGYRPKVDLGEGMAENASWMHDRGIIE